MKVETYECDEVKAEHPEVASEAIALINSLELDGQRTLISTADTVNPSRCPYRQMKQEEVFIFKLLCPSVQEAKVYCASAIPIRVLQVLEHAKSLEMFPLFQIWAAEGEVKDPVLVAYTDTETYKSSNIPFILARWADELDSWPQLVKTAMTLWSSKAMSELRLIEQKVAASIQAIESGHVTPSQANSASFYFNPI